MKNSNDTIGNRTRDLPACSTVPQPTGPSRHRVPQNIQLYLFQYRHNTVRDLHNNKENSSSCLLATGWFFARVSCTQGVGANWSDTSIKAGKIWMGFLPRFRVSAENVTGCKFADFQNGCWSIFMEAVPLCYLLNEPTPWTQALWKQRTYIGTVPYKIE